VQAHRSSSVYTELRYAVGAVAYVSFMRIGMFLESILAQMYRMKRIEA